MVSALDPGLSGPGSSCGVVRNLSIFASCIGLVKKCSNFCSSSVWHGKCEIHSSSPLKS